jgi:hypothetical protein
MDLFAAFVAGCVTEGFIKPIQVALFRRAWRKINVQAIEAETYAQETINKIDDFIVRHCRQHLGELGDIVDPASLSVANATAIADLVKQSYRVDVLLAKLQDSEADV